MNNVAYFAFSDELCLIKEAQWETIRHGFKALKGSLLGGTKLVANPGVMQAPRMQAAKSGKNLIHNLEGKGLKIHRARVKTPQSIQAKGLTDVPDDLLGMQMYGKGPEDVQRAMKALQDQGVTGLRSSAKARPGYHGVNIKGLYQGTPVEMQVNPGRISNMGQQMEHALGYKAKTAEGGLMFERDTIYNAMHDELEKIAAVKEAYGPTVHGDLSDITAKGMGFGKGTSALLRRGAVGADEGIRHPWNPMNTRIHSMPGQTRFQTLRDIAKRRKSAVDDIAGGIASGSGSKRTKGLMNLGEAQHSYMDLGAHTDKPLEIAKATKPAPKSLAQSYAQKGAEKVTQQVRRVAQKVPGGEVLGFPISAAEHVQSGMKAKGMNPLESPNLDRMQPDRYKADAASLGKAKSMASSNKRRIINSMVRNHGVTPEQAAQMYEMSAKGQAPGRISQLMGRTARDVGHVKRQVTERVRPRAVAREVSKAKPLLGRIARAVF